VAAVTCARKRSSRTRTRERRLKRIGALWLRADRFSWRTARGSSGFVCGRPDIDETVRRLRAYSEAGADCLYAPRVTDREQIARLVAAVAPKPLNLLINAPFLTVAEAAAMGVRRISVGGTLARTAWAGFLAAATEIAESGTFSKFENLPNVDELLGDR